MLDVPESKEKNSCRLCFFSHFLNSHLFTLVKAVGKVKLKTNPRPLCSQKVMEVNADVSRIFHGVISKRAPSSAFSLCALSHTAMHLLHLKMGTSQNKVIRKCKEMSGLLLLFLEQVQQAAVSLSNCHCQVSASSLTCEVHKPVPSRQCGLCGKGEINAEYCLTCCVILVITRKKTEV